MLLAASNTTIPNPARTSLSRRMSMAMPIAGRSARAQPARPIAAAWSSLPHRHLPSPTRPPSRHSPPSQPHQRRSSSNSISAIWARRSGRADSGLSSWTRREPFSATRWPDRARRPQLYATAGASIASRGLLIRPHPSGGLVGTRTVFQCHDSRTSGSLCRWRGVVEYPDHASRAFGKGRQAADCLL